MNILHISPDFTESCGVSHHVQMLLEEYQKYYDDRLFFMTNDKTVTLKKIEKLGISISFINFERGNRNPISFLKNIFVLRKFCIKNDINVIHTHHRYPELLASFVSKFTNARTVTTVHSFVGGFRALSFKSDQIIAVSKAVEEFLITKHKIRKKKIIHMYNFVRAFRPIDIKYLETFKEAYNIINTDKIMLFVGRLCYQKGIDILLEALDRLVKEHANIKLIIVGDIDDVVGGVDADRLMEKIETNENIIYTGPLSDVIDMYYLADFVVQPSRAETFGYVAIEAGLAGRPFIGSGTGGVTEIIEDRKSGLLCEPGNVFDLEAKIKIYLESPRMAQEHGKKLHERVKHFQNSEAYVNSLREIYLR